ncbi:uncharacterized protein LOC117505874 [Thalassophryne amazonica]|uniref:uncharacterized protein LOC117505874 n=1 Tax=Thalassophryne amazonica TaxID=390379 RepID=UPI001470EF5B|nr:uncharacterized protein LOC117505874 [Thalassophryne amazonica]XP_034021299.1 uncharacterized protein LOC117505874 [Thalassophryne amazonica]XP_034021300.1 uncharacterized protein LOC117505874 [Thalassophryne amazonica]
MTRHVSAGGATSPGVVQIFIGVLCVLISFTTILSPVLLIHAPLCIGVLFVVSGSLAVVSKRRTSFKLVLVTLVSSLCSVVLSLVGVVYVCWLLADWRPSDQLCGVFLLSNGSRPQDMSTQCHRHLWKLDMLGFGLRGVLLVLLSLQLCVSLTLCVFCGKAISLRHRDDAIKAMGKTDNILSSAMSEHDSSAALLDSADEET